MGTEDRDQQTRGIDRLETSEILARMNGQDRTVASAVESALPLIAQAVERISERLAAGGRLFYVGAGTSGRLGVLDAAECPPTFGVEASMVQGVLAGGEAALRTSSEGAEDDPRQGARDLELRAVGPADAVVGIAASGSTPYTLGALRYAAGQGALTVSISCNRKAEISGASEIPIEVETGPEVIAGSTRLKAGTAQKMILNMISTAAMIRLGLVYDNLMINVSPANAKLRRRAAQIVSTAAEIPLDEAAALLDRAGTVPAAILMKKRGCGPDEARERLQDLTLRQALDEAQERTALKEPNPDPT